MPAATLYRRNLTATERAILVDLSDTTNWPHGDITVLEVLRIAWAMELTTGGAWALRVGLVVEADATDGTVEWLLVVPLEATGRASGVLELVSQAGRGGLWMADDASDNPTAFVSNERDADQTWLQTDAGNLVDANGGATSSAGAGDLVVEAEEVTNGGEFAYWMTAVYQSRPG